jgi:hypothetical protein
MTYFSNLYAKYELSLTFMNGPFKVRDIDLMVLKPNRSLFDHSSHEKLMVMIWIFLVDVEFLLIWIIFLFHEYKERLFIYGPYIFGFINCDEIIDKSG